MEHKLSKYQLKMLASLLQQKEDAKIAYEETLEAEREFLAMIVKYANLPEGAYSIKQIGNDVVIFSEDENQGSTIKKEDKKE